MRRPLVLLLTISALGSLACGQAKSPERPTAELVFAAVAPSVVAIVNDDTQEREEHIRELETKMGRDPNAPKRVVDVSYQRTSPPDGTGFMIEGGLIVTAAHVVESPMHLKITTRAGRTVDAELFRIDDVRDVAILKPKTPLPEVPPLKLEEHDLTVGEPVWALGHTGRATWALSWGMSEGIASGVVDMGAAKLLLFDAAVYPGFSGGPVVTFHDHGRPEVAGVNHAILYTGGGDHGASPIFSAVAVSELHAVVLGKPLPLEKILADYANAQQQRTYADVFVTEKFVMTNDPAGRPMAHMMGMTDAVELESDHSAVIPAVALFFGLAPGKTDVRFEVRDPKGQLVAAAKAVASVDGKQRVGFASAKLTIPSAEEGKYSVLVHAGGKVIGRANVMVEDDEDESEALHTHDVDGEEGPDVDVVVGMLAKDDPTLIAGIGSFWAQKAYPRRVPFVFYARGTRGFSGKGVMVSAYVLDDAGHTVGHIDGCFQSEMRPELAWSCVWKNDEPSHPAPLLPKVGNYDIVFTLNDKPVAYWPMEAVPDVEVAELDRFRSGMRLGK
ncbi:hypothetical protein BH09MYX1_BH09MYX1_28700 [soil metagenome]